MRIDKANSPGAVSKGDQIFTQQTHAHRGTIALWQFTRQQSWSPIAA
jgi:hypothetical protein